MNHVANYAVAGQCADTLMILLPGAQHGPQDFMAAGFVSAVRERDLSMDILMAELAFSQVADLSAMHALHADIIEPAQAKAYRHIWLTGISIGGYVAMAYAQHYPDALHGMLLIAPYPGNRMTTNSIIAAGGIAAWAPAMIAPEDIEQRNWQWLKAEQTIAQQKTAEQTRESSQVEVHLAYGEHDRFAASHAMMAELLPPDHVAHIAGDHVWPVWHNLWCNFLDRRFGEHGRA